MASPAHPISVLRDAPVEIPADSAWGALTNLSLPNQVPISAPTVAHVVARSEEFVVLPGATAKLQKLLPVALERAYSGSSDFLGCLVLVSEQEARLVTVLTLWTDTADANLAHRDSAVVQDLLEPYVDRWLRTGSFAAFLTQSKL